MNEHLRMLVANLKHAAQGNGAHIGGGDFTAKEINFAVAQIEAADRALTAIHGEMDGREWESDTLSAIADHMREAGFELRESGCDDKDGDA
jgi:hypothetical protein